MNADTAPCQTSPRAELEARLLDLFAPARSGATPPEEPGSQIIPSLWHQDAIHRAKYLAQPALSLKATGRGGRGAGVEIAIPEAVRNSVGGPMPRAA